MVKIMTIKECYRAIGGNYDNIIARFRSDDRIQKFIYKFLEDESFINMQKALECGKIEDAFRAAHTLKGVSENLGFDKLSKSSHLITEALRTGDMNAALTYLPHVRDDYQLTIISIKGHREKILSYE